jgi:TPR repeat protein
MKSLVLVLVFLAWFAAPANADYDAGWAAFDRGDYKTAFREWKPLADKGVAKAQGTLAEMYRYGLGVPQDYKEAVRWYSLAADQGNVWAQFNLGIWYEDGEVVQRDYVRAHIWYNLASAQGNEFALTRREALAKKMTLAQIVEAQKLAREWKPKQ